MKKMKKKPREFIPNIFTVMNMFIGFMAMGFIMRGDPIRAGWLILLACFFDVFDGKLARLLGIPTRFGAEFDSFADTISFCAVPSLIIYLVYVEGLPPILGGLISFVPILFGTIRLAKYKNMTGESKILCKIYFQFDNHLTFPICLPFLFFKFRTQHLEHLQFRKCIQI